MFKITQWFGENPERYAQFGLPGHEGLDFTCPSGQPIFSVLPGVVYLVTTDTGNYGIQVRVQHADGIKSIYAHLRNAIVAVNQTVLGGQTLGYADNTGNSFGNHLHLSEKQDGTSYTDEDGIIWPNNFRDPWHHLVGLYDEYLALHGTVGWLYYNGLVWNKQNSHARVTAVLNLRESSNSNSHLLGKINPHTVAKILDPNPVNGYYKVLVPIDVTVNGQSNPAIGLHVRADSSDLKTAELDEMRVLKGSSSPDIVKLLHSHPQSAYSQVNSVYGTAVSYVIRIFQSWGGRNIQPSEFVGWNKEELKNRILGLPVPPTNVYVELHNEPNLTAEGHGYSWQNGTQFSTWAIEALNLFKQDSVLAGVKWVYPGLSPGGAISGVRYDSQQFLAQANLTPFDALGVHAYWSNPYPMSQALSWVDHNRARNKPILLTEVSRNDRPNPIPYAQYGAEYATFINHMKQRSNILGVMFFVGSASTAEFQYETWVTESNQVKGIASGLIANL